MDSATPEDAKPPPRVPGRAQAPGPGALAATSETELWRRWREEGQRAAHQRLVELYAGYAKSLAARLYARRTFDDVEFQDYQQLALLGLMEAIGRFDPGRGVQFKTFATPRIQGAVQNGLQFLTERNQQFAMRRRLAAERTASLVPEHMALGDPEKLLTQLGDVAVKVALAFILEGIGLGPEPREGLPGNAYAEVALDQARRRLWCSVEGLRERQRQVLELHYRQGKRFDDIARSWGVSKGRVSQIHAQALAQLRRALARAEPFDVSY